MRRTDDECRALQAAVTRSLIENHTLTRAIPRVLYAICERMSWSAAEVWCEDSESSLLRSVGRWPSRREQVRAVSETVHPSHLGGLLGRVWSTERALSTTNLAGDPGLLHRSAAFGASLRWAFAFPLRSGDRVRGVAVFFSRADFSLDARWRRTFEGLGQTIADVIAERQQEDVLRRRLHEEQFAREEAESAHARLVFLADAAMRIASSLDLEETYRNLAGAVVPALADWCSIELMEPGGRAAGSPRTRLVAYTDAGRALRIHRLHEPYPPSPSHPIHRVLRTGEGELVSEVSSGSALAMLAPDAELMKVLRDRRPTSLIVAPLVYGHATVGGLTLASTSGARGFSAADLALAEEVARRAAAALEHARAHTEALAELRALRGPSNDS